MNERKQYLGDSVYVQWDGFNATLTVENGFAVSNRIVLEPQVMYNLIAWIRKQDEDIRAAIEDLPDEAYDPHDLRDIGSIGKEPQ